MAAIENVIVQGLFFVWLIQIFDGGWNEGFKGSLGFYCWHYVLPSIWEKVTVPADGINNKAKSVDIYATFGD